MSLYIQISDFKGQTKIAADKFSKLDLQDYLDKWEVLILQDLLGCDLYTAFANDFALTGTAPTDPKFTAIWDAFCFDEMGCDIRRSESMNTMLSYLIYFYYLRDSKFKSTIGGVIQNEVENSVDMSFSSTNILTNYNQGLESYWSIQWYICENPQGYDYTAFNGQVKRLISGL